MHGLSFTHTKGNSMSKLTNILTTSVVVVTLAGGLGLAYAQSGTTPGTSSGSSVNADGSPATGMPNQGSSGTPGSSSNSNAAQSGTLNNGTNGSTSSGSMNSTGTNSNAGNYNNDTSSSTSSPTPAVVRTPRADRN